MDGGTRPYRAVSFDINGPAQVVVIRGEGVFYGASFKNTGAAGSDILFFDGNGQLLFRAGTTAAANGQASLPAGGVEFESDLQLQVVGATEVAGVAYVRTTAMSER